MTLLLSHLWRVKLHALTSISVVPRSDIRHAVEQAILEDLEVGFLNLSHGVHAHCGPSSVPQTLVRVARSKRDVQHLLVDSDLQTARQLRSSTAQVRGFSHVVVDRLLASGASQRQFHVGAVVKVVLTHPAQPREIDPRCGVLRLHHEVVRERRWTSVAPCIGLVIAEGIAEEDFEVQLVIPADVPC